MEDPISPLQTIYEFAKDTKKMADRTRCLAELKLVESLIEFATILLPLFESHVEEMDLKTKEIRKIMCRRALTRKEVGILNEFQYLKDWAYFQRKDYTDYLYKKKLDYKKLKMELNKLEKK